MVIPHSWRDCRPVLLNTRTGGGSEPWQEAALVQIWEEFSADDRKAFHRVTCLNSNAPDDMAVMVRLIGTLRSALGL